MFDSLLSALGYVGSSFDKLGGRELRGLLGGKPREALSFVPFSDELGITDPADIQHGRDLLHKAGIMDRDKPGWGGHLAGMATEVALDPFTLLGGAGMAKRALTGPSGAENLGRLGSMLHVERDPARLAELASTRPGQAGLNTGRYVAAWAGGPETLNEEISHGLTKMGALTGESRGLPLQSRIAAGLYRRGAGFGGHGESPFRTGLADMMLESAGHTARKPGLGGVVEGAKYWLDPAAHAGYHGQIARWSPAAASVYHAAPGAIGGGLTGAGAGIHEDAEDPVRGALTGGLLGALAGGIGSHAFYKPGGAARLGRIGESPSLNLKYDPGILEPPRNVRGAATLGPYVMPPHKYVPSRYSVPTPETVGLARHDPEWINNRTFYHGSAAPGLSPENLDIMKTDPANLHGRGIYTTEEAGSPRLPVTRGYGEARAESANDRLMENHFSQSKVLDAMKRGLLPEELMRSVHNVLMPGVGGWTSYGDPKYLSRQLGRNTNVLQGLGHSFDATGPEEMQRLLSDPSIAEIFKIFGMPQKAKPTIYQAQSDFGKILDLDAPPGSPMYRDARAALSKDSAMGWDPHEQVDTSDVTNVGDLLGEVRHHEIFGPAYDDIMKNTGYDALTHTGGGNWGRGENQHQVVIGLDPKYRRFEQLPDAELRRVLGGENAARFKHRDLTPQQQDELYKTFAESYRKSTGQAWPRDTFEQHAPGWDLWGTPPGLAKPPGFVSSRTQRSGMTKLSGAAGDPRAILRGMQELLAAKGQDPMWGAVPGDLGRHLEKAGFINPPPDAVNAVIQDVPWLQSILGQGANAAGGLHVPTAGGLAPVEKKFYGNRPYFEGLTQPPMSGQFSPDTLAKLREILGGESKSLGLKYDSPTDEEGLKELLGPERHARVRSAYPLEHALKEFGPYPEQFGLSRSDPEWINNRTFYHGTATPGLTPENLDISKTSHGNLYGQGIYKSDEAGAPARSGITKGYAKARFKDWEESIPRQARNRAMEVSDKIRDRVARRYGYMFDRDALDLVDPKTGKHINPYSFYDTLPPGEAERFFADWTERSSTADLRPRMEEKIRQRSNASPLIYQAQSDFGKILDLDQPVGHRLAGDLYDALSPAATMASENSGYTSMHDHFREDLRKAILGEGDVGSTSTAGRVIKVANDIQDVNRSHGNEYEKSVAQILQGMGYDALTHTGGSNWGGGMTPHQVSIGLNTGKYRKFEQLPQDELRRILGGENKAFDPRFPAFPGADRRLNEAADYIGPGYRPSRSVEEALGMRHGDDPHGVLDAIGRLSPAEQAALIGDLPEGMTPLGRGTEAWAGKTQGPNPWAVRVAPEVSPATGEPAYRAPIKGVLQPFRSNIFGEPGRGVQVEHLPLASTIFPPNQARGLAGQIYYARTGDSELEDLHNLLHDQSGANFREFNEVGRNLADYIRERYGYTNTEDLYHHPMNVAWRDSSRGMPLGFTHDAGAVEPNYGMQFPRPESPAPTADVLRALSGVNPQEAVRKAMERGAAGAMRGQGVRLPGLEEAISSDQLLRGLYDVASRKFEAYNRARGIAPGAR